MIKMVPLNIYALLQRWMQIQQNVIPAMCINRVFVGVNYGLNVALIHGWGSASDKYSFAGLGFKGSPIATSITQSLVCVTFLVYIIVSGSHKRTWRGWQLRRALRPARLKRLFVQQVVPLGLGGCFEEWQLEIVSLFAARMGKTLVATHNATLSLFVLLSSFMYGLIAAVSVRISQHLGAGAARRARAVSFYGLRASSVFGVIVALVFYFGRHHIARLFSSDPDVLHEAGRIMTLTGACYLGMAIFYATMATLSGQGRPMVVAAAFLIGAWGVGVPAAWALAHPAGLKLLGLWLGISCGYVIVTLITSAVVMLSDWGKIAEVARDKAEIRNGAQGGAGIGEDSDDEAAGEDDAGAEAGAPYQRMQDDDGRAGVSV
jgi:MATE family multidrug resistance protein